MRNMIYYITGISHKFTYGQTFTTTLELKYGRKPWEILPEILDYAIPPKMSAENPSSAPGDTASAQETDTLAQGTPIDVPIVSSARSNTNIGISP
jgi:hypothetical protein